MTTTTIEQQDQAFENWYASIDDCQSDEPERVYELSEEGMEQLTKECMLQGWRAAIAALPLPVMPEQAEPVKEKRAPVQGFAGGIPWDMHLRAYDAYCKKWSPQKALIEGGCRGGFGTNELDMFIPGWREELSERTALLARVAELEAENAKLKEEICQSQFK